MNLSQYAKDRGRNPASCWNICDRWGIGTVRYENGRMQRILSDKDIKELDRRWRK
jgi:hypothetical protein